MISVISNITKVLVKGRVSASEFDALVAQARTFVDTAFGSESWQATHIHSLVKLDNHSYFSLTDDVLLDKLGALGTSLAGMYQGHREAQALQSNPALDSPASHFDKNSVFIVHGHDHDALAHVENFVRKNDLIPVVLKDEPNKGRTLIEKFIEHSRVGYAVVILTPDDVASSVASIQEDFRARQNVILELGYFIGKLGRERVSVMYVDGVELPSDISGLVYIPFNPTERWKSALEIELKAVGLLV